MSSNILVRSFLLVLVLVHISSSIKCPEYFTPLNNKRCIKYSQATASYNMAETQCNKHASDLVSIDNAIDNAGIVDLIQTNDPVWVGMKCVESNSSEWACNWEDGTGNVTYRNFAPGNPTKTNGDCVVMFNNGRMKGKWFSEPCYEVHSFVCEVDPLPEDA